MTIFYRLYLEYSGGRLRTISKTETELVKQWSNRANYRSRQYVFIASHSATANTEWLDKSTEQCKIVWLTDIDIISYIGHVGLIKRRTEKEGTEKTLGKSRFVVPMGPIV